MCPVCLTSLAVTVATTTGAGAAISAFVVNVKRSIRAGRNPETQKQTQTQESCHERAESDGGERSRVHAAR